MATKTKKPARIVDNHLNKIKTDLGFYGCQSLEELKGCDIGGIGTIEWSGKVPVPKILDRVYVRFNRFSYGTVRGYFCERGQKDDGTRVLYLGVYVEPDYPPDWWVRQEERRTPGQRDRCTMVFGLELD